MTFMDSLLTSLRHLLGMSSTEIAAHVGLSAAQVLAAEAAPSSAEAAQILRVYGLVPEAIPHDMLTALDTADVRLFFFKGPSSTIHPDDVIPFLRALRWGRLWAAASPAREGMRCRERIRPAPVQGTYPTAAAKEGYALARGLRRRLELDNSQRTDIVSLAEDRLGVPVCVEALATRQLRAAAVIGRHRDAAIVISSARFMSTRARVDIAHELCHILFDPP